MTGAGLSIGLALLALVPVTSGATAGDNELLIILLPISVVVLIAVIFIVWFCCSYWKRREGQRKENVPSELNLPRQNSVFLATNRSGGIEAKDDLFTVPSYDGPAAVSAADAPALAVYGQQPVVAERGSKSIDRLSGSIAVVNGTDGQRRASLVSRQFAAESSALPINAILVDAAPEVLMAAHLGSRRSSVVVDRQWAGVVHDQRRRQSTTSASSSDALRSAIDASGRSGSLSADVIGGHAVENRKLSRTSYAEVPSSDRRASGSSVHFSSGGGSGAEQQQRRVSLVLPASGERRYSDGGGSGAEQQQRRVSLVLPASGERRYSDGGGGGGSRRATATGGPGMPGIDELHEALTTAVTAAVATTVRGSSSRSEGTEEVRAGSRALSLDGGAALSPPAPAAAQQQWRGIYGRQSWSGVATNEAATSSLEANYWSWPNE